MRLSPSPLPAPAHLFVFPLLLPYRTTSACIGVCPGERNRDKGLGDPMPPTPKICVVCSLAVATKRADQQKQKTEPLRVSHPRQRRPLQRIIVHRAHVPHRRTPRLASHPLELSWTSPLVCLVPYRPYFSLSSFSNTLNTHVPLAGRPHAHRPGGPNAVVGTRFS